MVIAAVIVVVLIYLSTYYHAEKVGRRQMESTWEVSLVHTKKGYLFDGPGNDKAIIFYPGAKVDIQAYSPVMRKLAAQGYDCFLEDPLFHLAFFDIGGAEYLMKTYEYKSWTLAGHSLGGVVAAANANKLGGAIDQVILLGSYPNKEIPDEVALLSIYGSKDGVLNMEKYEEKKSNWPKDQKEVIIEGGNHAQFGDYGEQKGDNPADITAQEQWDQTIAAITQALGKPDGSKAE